MNKLVNVFRPVQTPPALNVGSANGFCGQWVPVAVGKPLMGIGEVMDCQSQLLQVVRALHPLGCCTRRLNGWQKKGNQHADDRNNDEEFYKRERSFVP